MSNVETIGIPGWSAEVICLQLFVCIGRYNIKSIWLMLLREEFGVDGWSIYNFEAEYERQVWFIQIGIISYSISRKYHLKCGELATSMLTIKCAKHILHCLLFLPEYQVLLPLSLVTFQRYWAFIDEQLREVFQFRSKGRIPVMTWQHPTNGTTISRCSQPLSGIRVTRCTEDEALIKYFSFFIYLIN